MPGWDPDSLELLTAPSRVIVRGYASVYGVMDLDGEVIAPGAYDAAILARAPLALRLTWAHAWNAGIKGRSATIGEHLPIGRTRELVSDAIGLWFEAPVEPTTLGQDVARLVAAGALNAASISFVPLEQLGAMILSADLPPEQAEIAVVHDPAQPAALIELVIEDEAGNQTIIPSGQPPVPDPNDAGALERAQEVAQ